MNNLLLDLPDARKQSTHEEEPVVGHERSYDGEGDIDGEGRDEHRLPPNFVGEVPPYYRPYHHPGERDRS